MAEGDRRSPFLECIFTCAVDVQEEQGEDHHLQAEKEIRDADAEVLDRVVLGGFEIVGGCEKGEDCLQILLAWRDKSEGSG